MALYFMIALSAATAGALTGMGGGVIIKPRCDMLGRYDVQTIGVLSCITVFSMALVSLAKQKQQGADFAAGISLPLSIGSGLGGMVGQRALERLSAGLPDARVVVVQNVTLALIVGMVFWYMRHKDRLRSLHLRGRLPAVLAGVLLGFFSSFLGIGGPINVALIIFLFSLPTKAATVCSGLTILFAQSAKIGTILMGGGFGAYDLSALPIMVAGAILGGFLGAKLSRQLSEKSVECAFNGMQLLVLALCMVNIFRNR